MTHFRVSAAESAAWFAHRRAARRRMFWAMLIDGIVIWTLFVMMSGLMIFCWAVWG